MGCVKILTIWSGQGDLITSDKKACKEENSNIVTCIEILYRISQLKNIF